MSKNTLILKNSKGPGEAWTPTDLQMLHKENPYKSPLKNY